MSFTQQLNIQKNQKTTKQRMTGAVVNAPLVKNIILEMIKILNITTLIIIEITFLKQT